MRLIFHPIFGLVFGQKKCAEIFADLWVVCTSFDFAEALACLFVFSGVLLLHYRLIACPVTIKEPQFQRLKV